MNTTPLIALGIAMLSVALLLAVSAAGPLPLVIALLGGGAAYGMLRQAILSPDAAQPNTVTV